MRPDLLFAALGRGASPSLRLRGEGRGDGAFPPGSESWGAPSSGLLRNPTSPRAAGRGASATQTRQRRKTCASCGEEIGLKAGSQPAGILPLGSGRAGDSGGGANWSASFAGFATGRRSPLCARSTKTRLDAVDKPAPVVGNAGKMSRAAVNRTSEHRPTARAKRAVVPHIGSSPKRSPPVPMSQMRDWSSNPASHPARTSNVPEAAWFRSHID